MVVKTEKLAAAKTEDTAHLYGGFTELRGAVNPALGLALFPSITPEGLILTAGTLAELESEITVSPASIQAGALREVVVSGSRSEERRVGKGWRDRWSLGPRSEK